MESLLDPYSIVEWDEKPLESFEQIKSNLYCSRITLTAVLRIKTRRELRAEADRPTRRWL